MLGSKKDSNRDSSFFVCGWTASGIVFNQHLTGQEMEKVIPLAHLSYIAVHLPDKGLQLQNAGL